MPLQASEGADRPNRSPSSNFGKAAPFPARSVVRTKNADLFFHLLPLCSAGQARSYATRDDLEGDRRIDRSIDRIRPRTPTVPRAVAARARGIGKAERGEFASHVTAIMNGALSRARRSGPAVLAPISASGSLADTESPRPCRVPFAGNGEAERHCGKCGNEGRVIFRTEKKIRMPCHATQISPTFPACLRLPFECGTRVL